MGSTTAAPKRWFRRRGTRIAAVVLLAAIGFVAQLVWRVAVAIPGMPGKYSQQLRELTEQYQPKEGTDARPQLERVRTIYTSIDENVYGPIAGPGPRTTPYYQVLYTHPSMSTAPEMDKLSEMLARDAIASAEVEGLFDALDELKSLTKLSPEIPDRPLIFSQPLLKWRQDLARMLRARIELAAQKHDGPAVVRAFEESLALGRVSALGYFLLDHLVALAIDANAIEGVREAMMDHPFDEVTLRGLLAALDRQLPIAPMKLALEGERYQILDAIEICFSDDGDGDGRALPAPGVTADFLKERFSLKVDSRDNFSEFVRRLLGLLMASKREHVDLINREMDYLQKWDSTPRAKRATLGPSPDARCRALDPKYATAKNFLAALEKAGVSSEVFAMQVEGFRLMLALELFRLRHSAYPKSLSELAPEVLAAIPNDPYMNTGWGYRLADGSDPLGRPYLLYSFGNDGIDNNGTVPPVEEDSLALFARGGGYDYIINKPRPRRQDTAPPVSSGSVPK